jgi:hypothetical protein
MRNACDSERVGVEKNISESARRQQRRERSERNENNKLLTHTRKRLEFVLFADYMHDELLY